MKKQTHHCLTPSLYEDYVKTNLFWNRNGKFRFDIGKEVDGRLWTVSDMRVKMLDTRWIKDNGDNEFAAINNFAKLYDLVNANIGTFKEDITLYRSEKCPKPPGNPKGPGGGLLREMINNVHEGLRRDALISEISRTELFASKIQASIPDISKWRGGVPANIVNDSPHVDVTRFDVIDLDGNIYPTWSNDGILYEADLKEHTGTETGEYLFIIEGLDSKFGVEFTIIDLISYK